MSDTNSSTQTVTSDASVNTEAQQNSNQEVAEVVTPKLTKKLKLKVDGQELEENLPFEVDENNKDQVEYLKRNLQMSKAASKRMQESAADRKQAEQLIQALQNDPMRVLNDPRIMGEEKFRNIAEQFLAKKLQEQMLTPQERKQIEMEERLRTYEEAEKKQRDQAEQEQIKQLEEHYAQQFQKTIIDALQGSNLPKNPFTVKRMADLMQKNLQYGLELDSKYLAQLVKEDYQKELINLINGSEADQIISMFGEDVTNKIRKHDLAKFKASQTGYKQPIEANKSAQKSEAPRKMRAAEYEEYIKSKK